MKLKVISSHEISGVKHGGFVDTEDKDLAGHIDFQALIDGGHLEANKPASKTKEQ